MKQSTSPLQLVESAGAPGSDETRSDVAWPEPNPKQKKQYTPPEIIECGNVIRLTAGMNGSILDTGHNTRHGPGS